MKVMLISGLSILAFAKQRKTLRKLNQKFTYQEKNLTDRLQEIENKITTQTVKEERNSDKDEEIQLKTPESKKDEETQLNTPEFKKDEETQLKTPESKKSSAVGSEKRGGVPQAQADVHDVIDGVPLSRQKPKEEDGIEQYKIRLMKHYNTIIEDIIPKELINKMEGVLSADDRKDIERYPCYVGQNRKLVQIVLRHGFEGYQSFLSALNHVDNDKYKYISTKIKKSKVYETETMEMYNIMLEEKVPSRIQAMHNKKVREWKKVDMYLNDAGLDFYANACSILTNKHVVLVTGEPRCGKTLLLQNIALSLSADHDIIPGIHPHDILQYCNPNFKQVFVYDDFCGTPKTDDSLLNQWDQSTYRLQDFLRSGNLKIILSTRSDIYTSLTLQSKRPVFMFLNKNVLRINTPLYDDS